MTMLSDHVAESRWNIARAKAQLSRVVAESQNEPQIIESRGVAVAVIMDPESYRRLRDIEQQSGPETRLRRFIDLSRVIRERGGIELEIPARKPRRSPFSKRSR